MAINKRLTLLDAGNGRLAVIARYSEDFHRLIKAVPYAIWNPIAMRWEFPADEARYFRKIFSEWLILSSDDEQQDAGQAHGTLGNGENLSEGVFSGEGEREHRIIKQKRILRSMENAMRAMKYSKKTIQRYLAILERYIAYLDISINETNIDDTNRFLSHIERDTGASASTINQALSALKFFYKRVLGREMPLCRRPRSDKRLPEILSREEIIQLINSPRNLKHRTLLALAYSAGLRVSELVSIKLTDIDYSRGVILVRSGKGRKDRYTILAERMKKLLLAYIDLYKPKLWLFEGNNTRHITIRSAQEVFYKAKDLCGIEKAVSIHTLRHCFATHLLEDGTDIRYIQELLGHTYTKTTQLYTHVAKADFLRIKSPLDGYSTLEER